MFFSKISAQPVHSPRSGRLPLLSTDFCPRPATTGMVKRRPWRSDHRQERDGAERPYGSEPRARHYLL